MRLIQPFHESEHPVRNAELTQCRERNRESGLFSSIVMPTGRPTFTELFALCGEDEVNVIANSDMYFDASIRLAERCKQGQCLALSRWDVQADGRSVHFDVAWSQDVWIVRGRPSIQAEFTQGVLDCDKVLAWVLQSSGLAVLNPSRAIRSHHLHLSDVRTYRGRGRAPVSVPGPHLHVSPTDMWPLHYPRVHACWRAVGWAWQAPARAGAWFLQETGRSLAAIRTAGTRLRRQLLGQANGTLTVRRGDDPESPDARLRPRSMRASLRWQAHGTARVDIALGAPDGERPLSGADASGHCDADRWLRDGAVLYLQDACADDPGSPRATLDAVSVRVRVRKLLFG